MANHNHEMKEGFELARSSSSVQELNLNITSLTTRGDRSHRNLYCDISRIFLTLTENSDLNVGVFRTSHIHQIFF